MEKLNHNFVKICSGEANGYDDSDGFDTYLNLDTKEIVTDFWSTRGYCENPVRHCIEKDKLTAEQMDLYNQVTFAKAKELFMQKIPADKLVYVNMKFWAGEGLPCVVTGGRKFKGTGLLKELNTYRYHYSRWNSTENTTANIETADGKINQANAKYLKLDLSKINLDPIIAKNSYWILSEDGYNQIHRYSNPTTISEYILEYFQA